MHNSYLQDGSIFNLVECWATQNPWEEKCPKNIGHIYHHFSLLLIDRQTFYGLKCFSCRKNNCLETTHPPKKKNAWPPASPHLSVQLALEWHPDKHAEDEEKRRMAEEKFKLMGEVPDPPPPMVLAWLGLSSKTRSSFTGICWVVATATQQIATLSTQFLRKWVWGDSDLASHAIPTPQLFCDSPAVAVQL